MRLDKPASTEARIGLVFGRLGIVPEACSTWFLPRIVGIQTARSFVVDRSPVALALARQLVCRHSTVDHPLEAHLAASLAMYWTSLGDGKEGVAAF